MSHGVRKVNESIIRDGRAIILTHNLETNITQEQWDTIGNGTIYVDPIVGLMRYKSMYSKINDWEYFDPANVFKALSIGEGLIKERAVTTGKIGISAVNSINIANSAVNDDKVEDKSLTEKSLKPLSFTGNIFINNSVNGIKITDETVDGVKLIDATIPETKLIEKTITLRSIADKTITGVQIKDSSLDGDNLKDLTIPGIKIMNKTIDGDKITDKSLLNINLPDLLIDNRVIGYQAIETHNIKDFNVTEDKLNDESVTITKLAKNSVNGDKVVDKSIPGNKLLENTISIINMDSNIKNILNNCVTHENSVARVYGDLKVDGDIVSTSNDCTKTITGFKVYNPVFRDFAEAFMTSDKTIEPGDVVEIEEGEFVRKANPYSKRVVGVVSDQYAICLGATMQEIENKEKVSVGLIGRVYVKVDGAVEAGDYIIPKGDGLACATKEFIQGCIIGKALENKTEGINKILCIINPI